MWANAIERVGVLEGFPKSGAHEVHQKILVEQHFIGVQPEGKVRFLGQTPQHVCIHGGLACMFLKNLFTSATLPALASLAICDH